MVGFEESWPAADAGAGVGDAIAAADDTGWLGAAEAGGGVDVKGIEVGGLSASLEVRVTAGATGAIEAIGATGGRGSVGN